MHYRLHLDYVSNTVSLLACSRTCSSLFVIFAIYRLVFVSALVTFELKSGGNDRWIKFNANMTGVYRVHYDDDNWLALIAQLKQNHSVSNLVIMPRP